MLCFAFQQASSLFYRLTPVRIIPKSEHINRQMKGYVFSTFVYFACSTFTKSLVLQFKEIGCGAVSGVLQISTTFEFIGMETIPTTYVFAFIFQSLNETIPEKLINLPFVSLNRRELEWRVEFCSMCVCSCCIYCQFFVHFIVAAFFSGDLVCFSIYTICSKISHTYAVWETLAGRKLNCIATRFAWGVMIKLINIRREMCYCLIVCPLHISPTKCFNRPIQISLARHNWCYAHRFCSITTKKYASIFHEHTSVQV